MDAIGLTIVAGTFILAGGVKGVIGLGLPTVSLAILTIAFDLTTAMALLLVPSFVTNVWQALVGGEALNVIKRLWWFFTIATATIWIGSLALPAVATIVTAISFHSLAFAWCLGFGWLRGRGHRFRSSLTLFCSPKSEQTHQELEPFRAT